MKIILLGCFWSLFLVFMDLWLALRDEHLEFRAVRTMKSGLAQALLSACVVAPAVHGLSLEKCHYRMTNMQHTEESFKLAIFDCTFDDDLYLKSRLDEDLAPIPSVASKEAVSVAAGLRE